MTPTRILQDAAIEAGALASYLADRPRGACPERLTERLAGWRRLLDRPHDEGDMVARVAHRLLREAVERIDP